MTQIVIPPKSIHVIEAKPDMNVIILRSPKEAEDMIMNGSDKTNAVPYKIEMYVDHMVMYTMEAREPMWWHVRRHVRSFWFNDLIAMNEVIQRIHHGGY